MKNSFLWQLGGLTFTAILGTLLHFLYGWTGCLALTPISAVNESTWEHMKILFFPMLFFAILQYFIFGKNTDGFWWIQLLSISLGTLLVPVLFYTLNGVFGKTPDWLNILLFFVCAGVAYYLAYTLLQTPPSIRVSPILPILALSLFAVLFIVFTYAPPKIPLFQDPLYRAYGIVK